MKHITKQILGSLGLLAVIAMTVVAYNTPSPTVSANSITDTITVTVVAPGVVEIIRPENNGIIIRDEGNTKIEFTYDSIKSAHFDVYKTVKGEKTKLVQGHDFKANKDSGSSFFNLKENLEEGYYIIEFTYIDNEGMTQIGNSVKFTYMYHQGNIPVPDTGTFTHGILDDLNISQLDFVLAGAIVFFSVAGFSTYLVLRKRK